MGKLRGLRISSGCIDDFCNISNKEVDDILKGFKHVSKPSNIDREILLQNGSMVDVMEYDKAKTVRSNRAYLWTFKDMNGDIIEMDTRDGSYRVVYTAEELEED